VPDAVGLDEGFRDIIEFGFRDIIEFGFRDIIEFGFRDIIEFGEDETLGFGFVDVVEFGAVIDDPSASGGTTFFASTAGLLWPEPVQADADYYFFIDADRNDATGGVPGEFGFPGAGQTVENGVDLIVRIETGAAGDVLTVFDYVDETTGYVPVANPVDGPLAVENVTVGLFQDLGGAIEEEEQAIGTNLRARVQNALLQAAGWVVGSPLSVEVLSVVDCSGEIAGIPIDCQCTDCGMCPDFPGCEGPDPEPITVGEEIPVETAQEEVSFEDPVPPVCAVEPASVVAGGGVTVTASEFPPGTGAALNVLLEGAVLGTTTVDATGTAVAQVTIPAGTPPGEAFLTALLEGHATSAECAVEVVARLGGNEPPAADAGENARVECAAPGGAVVMLDGSASSDPDGDALIFAWSAPGIQFDDPTSPRPTALFPLGTTTVTLLVTDGMEVAEEHVEVLVEDTTPPAVFASLLPYEGGKPHKGECRYDDDDRFVVGFSATDACDPSLKVIAKLRLRGCNRTIKVANGQIIEFEEDDDCEIEREGGVLEIEATGLRLRVRAKDDSGNIGRAKVAPGGQSEGDDGGIDPEDLPPNPDPEPPRTRQQEAAP
jgi:hypothetical protein